MPNRSHARSRRPARRAANRGRNRARTTLGREDQVVATNLITVATVDGNTSAADLTFNRAVTPGDPASPGATDIQFTGTSATTRNAISTTPISPTTVRVALSGALSSGKTYNCVIDANQGLIVPEADKWGTRSKTFAT